MLDHGPVADPGGGAGGPDPPFVPRCRLFNIGPKIGPPSAPPFFDCRPNLDPPPPFKNPGSAPVAVHSLDCCLPENEGDVRPRQYTVWTAVCAR